MSAVYVQTLFKKCRSCEMTISTPSYSQRYRCSQCTESRSRLFVGSSSSSAVGFPNSACASSTRTFCPPCNSPILRSCNSPSTPSPSSSTAASASAVYPPSSPTIPSSSPCRVRWLEASRRIAPQAFTVNSARLRTSSTVVTPPEAITLSPTP